MSAEEFSVFWKMTFMMTVTIRWFTRLIVQIFNVFFPSALYLSAFCQFISISVIYGICCPLFFLFDNSFTFRCIRSILPRLSSFSISSHCSFHLLPDEVDFWLTCTSAPLYPRTSGRYTNAVLLLLLLLFFLLLYIFCFGSRCQSFHWLSMAYEAKYSV